MMRRRFAALLVTLAVAAPAAAQVVVTGDWDITVNSPQGANTVKMSLQQDGEKITGLFKSPMGELPFTGSIAGSDLKFRFTLPFQGQALDITLTGTVNDPSMSGKADFGGFAEGDWTAKRAVATADAAPASNAAPAGYGGATVTGIGGSWVVTVKTPNGDFPATATLTESSGQLSGTFASQLGEAPVSGTLDGAAVKLSLTAPTPQGSMSVTMTGDLQGDEIVNGKADVTGMGILEWTARRKQ
jgi:hypothetical protein